MGQSISSIFEEIRTPSTRDSPCQYNTAKAIFVTNSQGIASSLPHSSNMGQKLSSVQPRKEDTSHAISGAQHKKEPTSRGLGSQRKINFVNESFPPLPQSEKRKIYEKKEDAAPSLQYNFAAQSRMKISSISESTPLYVTSSYKGSYGKIKEQGDKISQTLYHLDQILSPDPDNVIYGFWQCNRCEFSPPKEKEVFLGPLQIYQHKTPEVLYNNFKKTCDCKRENMITSFRVYTRPRYSGEPTLEIIFHLFWRDYYRVFGEFKCQNCRKKWKSAYIWILLKQFINKTPGPQLCEGDFYMQKCKRCNGKSSIVKYESLKISKRSPPHKKELCVKCQAGDY
ncbi:7315_t:CDS:2, partial [Diversispora eburnea]